MTSRLLMDAVKSQGQPPRQPPARVADPVHAEETHAIAGMRSDAIMEETKRHLLHRQQQLLQEERKAQMQQGTGVPAQPQQGISARVGGPVGGFGNLAGGDLRNLLSKSRGGSGPRPGGFGGGVSSRLGPVGAVAARLGPIGVAAAVPATEEEEIVEPKAEDVVEKASEVEGEEDDEEDVSFNVTMPAKALAEATEEGMEEGEEGWEEAWEEEGEEEAYYGGGYRGRGRGRGAFRGRGGRGGTFVPGVRGRGGFKARGGIRGRGRGGGPAEMFAAKKWVNPALVAAQAAASGGTVGEAAVGAGTASGAGTGSVVGAAAAVSSSVEGSEGGGGSKVYRKEALKNAAVVGKLNLDGDLSSVGRRGLYKAAKWVKSS